VTSIGILVLVAGVGLIWCGVTDVSPVQAFKDALSGKGTTAAPKAAPATAAQPATAG
jgi:hypothetical protein